MFGVWMSLCACRELGLFGFAYVWINLKLTLRVRMHGCLSLLHGCLFLWRTDDPSRVYPVSHTMAAEIGSMAKMTHWFNCKQIKCYFKWINHWLSLQIKRMMTSHLLRETVIGYSNTIPHELRERRGAVSNPLPSFYWCPGLALIEEVLTWQSMSPAYNTHLEELSLSWKRCPLLPDVLHSTFKRSIVIWAE